VNRFINLVDRRVANAEFDNFGATGCDETAIGRATGCRERGLHTGVVGYRFGAGINEWSLFGQEGECIAAPLDIVFEAVRCQNCVNSCRPTPRT